MKEKERRRHQARGVSSFRAASILSASVEATRMRAPFGMRFRRCLLDLSCANALAMLSGAVIRAGLGNSTLPVEVGTRRQSSQVQLGMLDAWRFFIFAHVRWACRPQVSHRLKFLCLLGLSQNSQGPFKLPGPVAGETSVEGFPLGPLELEPVVEPSSGLSELGPAVGLSLGPDEGWTPVPPPGRGGVSLVSLVPMIPLVPRRVPVVRPMGGGAMFGPVMEP